MSTLEFRDLTVTFGHGRSAFRAVRGVDLVAEHGQILGLVGESGSGKSTIARTAVGLSEPSSGSILLDGTDVAHARGARVARRRAIQMVFQDPYSCLDPRMTIGESIDEALLAACSRLGEPRTPSAERQAEIGRLLTLVHLPADRARDHPNVLSGGQRQRVAIARALAARPAVLLADEVTSALDVSVQGSVLNLLAELQRELALTVIFISHNMALVRHLCDRIAVMYRGEIVEQGPTLDIVERPQQEYTQRLLSAIPEVGVPIL